MLAVYTCLQVPFLIFTDRCRHGQPPVVVCLPAEVMSEDDADPSCCVVEVVNIGVGSDVVARSLILYPLCF